MMEQLWLSAAVEATLFCGLGSFLMVRGARLYSTARKKAQRLADCQQQLTAYLVSGGPIPDAQDLPHSERLELLLRLSSSLSGEVRERIQSMAEHWQLIAREKRFLRSGLWWRRLSALRFFSGLGLVPEELEACLEDPHPLVRAEAIYLVPLEPNPARVEALVRELFCPPSPARFASQCVLRTLASQALEPLKAWLLDPPEEVSLEVALRTACAVAAPELTEAALKQSQHSRAEVQEAACELMSSIGGEACESRLRELLSESNPARVRRAAARGLGHLSRWQAAPDLARLLQEEDWDLRHEAALSLRQLGPPGLLFLRQVEQQPEHPGAPLAKLVLSQC